MSIFYQERNSESPYIETIMYGQTVSDGSAIRPAESGWHMVFVRNAGGLQSLIVGPWTAAGSTYWEKGSEILWVKFKLGVFMPHLSFKNFMDTEVHLPDASSKSFWLSSCSWQHPDYENVETFVARLVREGVLERDLIVSAALQGQMPEISSRTVRYRFLRATGLTQSYILQFERAKRAAALLHQGASILDTVDEAGYFDQPHLTKALKHFFGHTPKQWIAHPLGATVRMRE
jgi:AraC-like DNA-binding protein